MKRMYEYKCRDCFSISSHLVEETSRQDDNICDSCGGTSDYVISAPHFDYRMGLDPIGNPTMGEKWAKMHIEAARKGEAKNRE